MTNEQFEEAMEAERLQGGFRYAVGICSLNDNRKESCYTIEYFRTREERDNRALHLEAVLHDNTTHCWED